MRLAKERTVRFRAWLQCAEAAHPKWSRRITVLRKKLLDIDDTQSDVATFPEKAKSYHAESHVTRVGGFPWVDTR